MFLINRLRNCWIALLVFLPFSLWSYIYLFTDMGDVFRTSDGVNFSLVSNIGDNTGVSLIFINDNLGYMLESNGRILRTVDRGESWEAVTALPTDDAVDIANRGGYYYVLTRSGDLYRGEDITSLSLLTSLNGDDFVGLAYDGSYIFALTVSGDVWRSEDGESWVLVGSTGSADMVAIEVKGDTVYAVDRYGDVFRSVDGGEDWVMVGTVSQFGVADLHVSADGMMFLCFDTGELMKMGDNGWQYLGTAGQVGVVGMSTSGPVTLVGDTCGVGIGHLRVEPLVTTGVLKILSEAGEVWIYSLDGRVVKRVRKGAGEIEVDMRGVGAGIYFVRFRAEVVRVVKL